MFELPRSPHLNAELGPKFCCGAIEVRLFVNRAGASLKLNCRPEPRFPLKSAFFALRLAHDLFELLRLQHGEHRTGAALFRVAEGAAVALDAALDRAQELALPVGELHLRFAGRLLGLLQRAQGSALGAGAVRLALLAPCTDFR